MHHPHGCLHNGIPQLIAPSGGVLGQVTLRSLYPVGSGGWAFWLVISANKHFQIRSTSIDLSSVSEYIFCVPSRFVRSLSFTWSKLSYEFGDSKLLANLHTKYHAYANVNSQTRARKDSCRLTIY